MPSTHAVRLFALFSVLAFLMGCSRPERPKDVAMDATWVEGGTAGYWQICKSRSDAGAHCTIWNEGGIVLLNETFRPLDGGSVPSAQELAKLRDGGPGTGPYQVCLSTGRILLPESR